MSSASRAPRHHRRREPNPKRLRAALISWPPQQPSSSYARLPSLGRGAGGQQGLLSGAPPKHGLGAARKLVVLTCMDSSCVFSRRRAGGGARRPPARRLPSLSAGQPVQSWRSQALHLRRRALVVARLVQEAQQLPCGTAADPPGETGQQAAAWAERRLRPQGLQSAQLCRLRAGQGGWQLCELRLRGLHDLVDGSPGGVPPSDGLRAPQPAPPGDAADKLKPVRQGVPSCHRRGLALEALPSRGGLHAWPQRCCCALPGSTATCLRCLLFPTTAPCAGCYQSTS